VVAHELDKDQVKFHASHHKKITSVPVHAMKTDTPTVHLPQHELTALFAI
jgi:hypothetical protein